MVKPNKKYGLVLPNIIGVPQVMGKDFTFETTIYIASDSVRHQMQIKDAKTVKDIIKSMR